MLQCVVVYCVVLQFALMRESFDSFESWLMSHIRSCMTQSSHDSWLIHTRVCVIWVMTRESFTLMYESFQSWLMSHSYSCMSHSSHDSWLIHTHVYVIHTHVWVIHIHVWLIRVMTHDSFTLMCASFESSLMSRTSLSIESSWNFIWIRGLGITVAFYMCDTSLSWWWLLLQLQKVVWYP